MQADCGVLAAFGYPRTGPDWTGPDWTVSRDKRTPHFRCRSVYLRALHQYQYADIQERTLCKNTGGIEKDKQFHTLPEQTLEGSLARLSSCP